MDADMAQRIAILGHGCHRIVTGDGRRALVKRRAAPPAGFFEMEAFGLERLRATHTLRVPEVYAVTADTIVIEDLGSGRATPEAWARAGSALARLHGHTSPHFGLERDGWCGDSAQRNTPMTDGYRFFAECRLAPQAQRAYDAGRLVSADLAAVERLAGDLESRVPPQSASLLHGDLWTGNLHACADGELALIDAAAVHFGWAEAELAMLTLFGSPPEVFFAAYESEAQVDSSWRTRAPLYNLYHLLNHLNLFGAAYLDGVRRALRELG